MPFPNLDFTHSGGIGGVLAGKAARQAEDQRALDMANTAMDIQAKQLSAMAKQDLTAAVKEAGPDLAKIESPAEKLIKLSEIAIKSGAVAEGGDLLSQASTSYKNEASAKQTALEMSLESANAVASVLDNVNDGASLEAMYERTKMQGIDTGGYLDMLRKYQMDVGGGDPNFWDEYLEEAVTNGRFQIMSQKDSITIKMNETRMETERLRQAELRQRMDVVVPAQVAKDRALAAKYRKSGETKTKTTTLDRTLASNLITTDYDLEENKDKLYVLASTVVTRSKELLDTIPSLTKEEAMSRAYKEMKKNGDFGGLRKAEYEPGTYENPGVITGKKEDLEPNGIYTGVGVHAGKLVTWTGTTFLVVKPRKSIDYLDEEEDDESLDEEEEE